MAKQTLPPEISCYAWNALSYQEKVASGGSTKTLGLSLIFVFLILAALYESSSLSLCVLLRDARRRAGRVPRPSVRATSEQQRSRANRDLVVLVGLSREERDPVLVEFAKDGYEKGQPLIEAALQGARLRLRPILMTSLAFIFGCFAAMVRNRAGSAARRVLGTRDIVLAGMSAATLLGIFFIPSLLLRLRWRPKAIARAHARRYSAGRAPVVVVGGEFALGVVSARRLTTRCRATQSWSRRCARATRPPSPSS